MKKTLLLSIATITLMASETFTLEKQTVTATHLQQDELSYAAPVEIYTTQDIENSKSKNIYDFLNQETSVSVLPSFGNQFAQKIDMRGYGIGDGYENIVIVVNGRRMNNIDSVPQLLSSIPIDSVEKIEILKGAGSVEYGDGANAGVINITTKDFSGVNLKAYTGSFDSEYISFGAGYAEDLFSISAFGDYFETAGQKELKSNAEKDSARTKNGAFNLKLYPVDELELRLSWAASRINTIYTGPLTQAQYDADPTQSSTGDDNYQLYDTDLWSFGVSYNLNSALSLETNVYIEDKKSDYRTVGYKSSANYDYNSGDLSMKYNTETINIATGISFFNGQRYTVADFATTNETSKDNLAAFIKTDYRFSNHNITAGARVEKVEYEYKPVGGTRLNDDSTLKAYELGYNYKLSNEQSAFASYSHSFQAPDIDRFFSFGGAFNGFIKPMKTDTYNLGYNYFIDNNKFKATAFYINLEDEIYYDPTIGLFGENSNLDKTSKLGFELYDKYLILENLYISANYTYIDATIEKDDIKSVENKTLPGVSKHNLVTSLGYAPTPKSKFIASHTYRSSTYALEDFENSASQKQEAYNSTDITATYQYDDHIDVFAKIQNLFDEKNGLWLRNDVIYPVNFQRNIQVGLSGKF